MLMHDNRILTYYLELVFLWNDEQAAHVVPTHQTGSDIVHTVFLSFHIDALIAFMLSSL